MVSKGYSARQIGLHWLVFVIVAFQFLMGDNMTHLFWAAHGGKATDVAPIWAPIHIFIGVLVLAAMLARLWLRRTDGVPPPVAQAKPLEWLAAAVHVGLYLDLIVGALVGLAAYFLWPQLAWWHHLLMRPVLLWLVILHVLGALWHGYKRDAVATRMIRPAR